MSRRVIVCGSREMAGGWAVRAAFLEIFEDWADAPLIVHGGARGADALADAEARRRGFDVEVHPVHPADWEAHGRGAGPKRNREMADAGAELCIAFWDGQSRGTAGMISLAVQAGIRCVVVPI